MAVDKNKLEVEEEAFIHKFYKIVLSWDYYRLLGESEKSDKYKGDGSELGLKKVKDKYKSVDDYLATFEPLLFEEVKAQITQGQDEEGEDEDKEGMIVECNETDGFHLLLLVFGKEDWGPVSQNDLLLLLKEKVMSWNIVSSRSLHDENDRAYTPKIVRIGLKAHHSVQAVSMDYLVEQKLAGMDFQSSDKQKQEAAGRDRDTLRASIMDEAAIVFSTLSFSGSSLFSKLKRNFDIVVIDEAAQAVEPATLVPLATGCKQVFLVGDPVQLPATVISPIAEKFGYSMSLFKRFQRAGYPVQMLKTQYRMHPEIRSFPSNEFYAGELEDGDDVEDRTKRQWHQYRCFGPFCFFDIYEGRESKPQEGAGSWENLDEVEFALLMYNKLVSRYPDLKSSSRMAIISPYRQQVKRFRTKFRETFGVDLEKVVDINTVDGFQGEEKGIGFVADFRRMNVGITRARSSVLVVGSAAALRKDKHWKNLIQSAEERNVLFKVSKPYAEFFSEESIEHMKVSEALPDQRTGYPDGMEVDMPFDNAAVPEEEDFGDGDAEPYDGGDED